MHSDVQPNPVDPAMSEISFPIDQIQANLRRRPMGYLREVLSVGWVDGDRIYFTMEEYHKLKDKYEPHWRDRTVTITLGNTPECKTCVPAVN